MSEERAATTAPEYDKQSAADTMRIAGPLQLCLAFAVFSVLAIALHHKGFNSPLIYDSTFLSDNLRSFARHDVAEVMRIMPQRAFTLLTFYENYLISGMDPYYFRMVNAVLVAATGLVLVLMFQILYQIPGLSTPGSESDKTAVSYFLGLLFVVHPLQGLVILYVWQRAAIMACLFYFSALTLYLAVRTGRAGRNDAAYTLVIIFIVAGVLSKENVLTLPIVLLLAEAILFRTSCKQLFNRAVAIGLLTLPALIAYLLVAHALHKPTSLEPQGIMNRLQQHYLQSGLSPVQVLMTECRVFFSYLFMMLVPFHDNVQLIRVETVSKTLWNPPSTLVACTGLIGLMAFGVAMVRKAPALAFGILFTTVVMTPELILSPQYLFFGHRAIMPMAGVLMLLGQVILHPISWSRHRMPERAVAGLWATIAVAVVASIGVTTVAKAARWNPSDFWKDAYRRLPPLSNDVQKLSYLHILVNYGGELLKSGEYAGAIAAFETALKIKSDSHEIHGNLGSAMLRQGRGTAAIEHYRKAIEINPDSARAHLELGNAMLALGKAREAIKYYKKAHKLIPDSAEPFTRIANVLQRYGKVAQAKPYYLKAIELNPASWEAHNRLGNILVEEGKPEAAIVHYAQAVKANPGNAELYNNLGAGLLRIKRIDEAKNNFRKAVALQPGSAKALANLGIASLASGKPQAAKGYLKKAVEADGNLAAAHLHLGHAYQEMGETREAADQYRNTLKIAPDLVAAHFGLANAMEHLGDLSAAEKHYKEALRINPRHYPSHNAVGIVLASRGELTQAIQHFRKALDLNPGFAGARNNLAKALRQLENTAPDK
jgi:tetratricopeptide (TPR) repeat protein